jgi:hypothetical protein
LIWWGKTAALSILEIFTRCFFVVAAYGSFAIYEANSRLSSYYAGRFAPAAVQLDVSAKVNNFSLAFADHWSMLGFELSEEGIKA